MRNLSRRHFQRSIDCDSAISDAITTKATDNDLVGSLHNVLDVYVVSIHDFVSLRSETTTCLIDKLKNEL